METLKNLTLIQWIGIMVGLNSLLMGATAQLTVLFGTAAVPYIIAVATLGNGALGVFVTVVGGQSSQVKNVLAMPGVEHLSVNALANSMLATIAVDHTQPKIAPTSDAVSAVSAIAKSAAAFLLAVVLASMIFAAPAMAQQNTPASRKLNLPIDPLGLNGTALTGNASKDLQALWQKIITASSADLQYASLMAATAGTPASKQRKECWDAIIVLNTQASGANVKDASGNVMVKPDPHLFADVESLAEVMDNLSPQGPLFTSCAGAAEMAKMNVLQFISTAVAGAAGFAATGL